MKNTIKKLLAWKQEVSEGRKIEKFWKTRNRLHHDDILLSELRQGHIGHVECRKEACIL